MRNAWYNYLIGVVVVLACDGLAARSGFAEDVVVVRPAHRATSTTIRTELRREDDHPHYGVELEPHFVLQWGDLPYRTSAGVGIGFRASIPVLDPGPIPNFNNSLAVSFGLDWAHFGSCRYDAPDCYGNDFWFPVVMQWNFYLTPWWSVFPEVGVAIHHAAWSYGYYEVVAPGPGPGGPPPPPGPPGPRGPGPDREFVDCGPGRCDYVDHITEVAFVSWLGTRFAVADRFTITLRVGWPSLYLGASFFL